MATRTTTRRLGLDSLIGVLSASDLQRVTDRVVDNLGGDGLPRRRTFERDLDEHLGSLLELVTLPTTDDEDFDWVFWEPNRLPSACCGGVP